jgi:hypothetical protein
MKLFDVLEGSLKGLAQGMIAMGFQWLIMIKMHAKGGDGKMRNVSRGWSAERRLQFAEIDGHCGPAERTDLI